MTRDESFLHDFASTRPSFQSEEVPSAVSLSALVTAALGNFAFLITSPGFNNFSWNSSQRMLSSSSVLGVSLVIRHLLLHSIVLRLFDITRLAVSLGYVLNGCTSHGQNTATGTNLTSVQQLNSVCLSVHVMTVIWLVGSAFSGHNCTIDEKERLSLDQRDGLAVCTHNMQTALLLWVL